MKMATPAISRGRDLFWGFLFATFIASVPNFIMFVLYTLPIQDRVSTKYLMVSFIGVGAVAAGAAAALFARLRFGTKILPSNDTCLVLYAYPIALFIAGAAASAYFYVVVGPESGEGLGATLTETIDSSLAPCFYLLLFILLTKSPKVPLISAM